MPKGEGAQDASKKAKAIQKAATPNAREDRATPKKIVPKSDTVQAAIKASNDKKTANKYKEAGPAFRGVGSNFYVPPVYIPKGDNGSNNQVVIPPVIPPPVVPPPAPPIPPVKGGIGESRNIRGNYLALIKKLTANLLKNADSLLFAYNFQSIERMVSYSLEEDDQSQRESQIVSNIKRSFSGVPLTELQIRDRLNAVVNQISQEIGDLTPASTKLAKFGMKKDNRDFQGGTPRIQNSRAVYDLELKLPSLEGFNYSVTYRIKCFDID